GQDVARLGRGRVRPLPRECLRATALAGHALSRALGRPVRARAVLVAVGARAVAVVPGVAGLLVLRERELAGFGRRGGVLSPTAVDSLHQSARDRRTWLRAAAAWRSVDSPGRGAGSAAFAKTAEGERAEGCRTCVASGPVWLVMLTLRLGQA
ncbi:hypothetical protein H3146_09735, partial [Streptomyces sp. OF3]|nr:hypothetical protein [Streptomyces alkaliterrae]